MRRSEFGPKTAEEIIERVGQCVRVLDTVGCATLVGKSDGCFATRATCLGAASIKRPTTQCQHGVGLSRGTGMMPAFSTPRARLSRRPSWFAPRPVRSQHSDVFGRCNSRSAGDCSSRIAGDCSSRNEQAAAA